MYIPLIVCVHDFPQMFHLDGPAFGHVRCLMPPPKLKKKAHQVS